MSDEIMAKPTSNHKNQMILPGDFFLPFGGQLDEKNRWVKLAALIPWSHAEKSYNKHFKNTERGQEALNVRMALGALIIQARMQLPDRETVESIQENPYMQYFIGLSGFQQKPPFHHSMMTHFRKRLVHVLAEINEIIAAEGIETAKDRDENDDDFDSHGDKKRELLSKRTSFLLQQSNKNGYLKKKRTNLLNPIMLKHLRMIRDAL